MHSNRTTTRALLTAALAAALAASGCSKDPAATPGPPAASSTQAVARQTPPIVPTPSVQGSPLAPPAPMGSSSAAAVSPVGVAGKAKAVHEAMTAAEASPASNAAFNREYAKALGPGGDPGQDYTSAVGMWCVDAGGVAGAEISLKTSLETATGEQLELSKAILAFGVPAQCPDQYPVYKAAAAKLAGTPSAAAGSAQKPQPAPGAAGPQPTTPGPSSAGPVTEERKVYQAMVAAEGMKHTKDTFTQHMIRVEGSYLTQDAEAVEILCRGANSTKEATLITKTMYDYGTGSVKLMSHLLAYGVPAYCPSKYPMFKAAALSLAEQSETTTR